MKTGDFDAVAESRRLRRKLWLEWRSLARHIPRDSKVLGEGTFFWSLSQELRQLLIGVAWHYQSDDWVFQAEKGALAGLMVMRMSIKSIGATQYVLQNPEVIEIDPETLQDSMKVLWGLSEAQRLYIQCIWESAAR